MASGRVSMTFLLLPFLAMAADTPWEDASSQDLNGYVRSLSLDLRAKLPTPEELSAVEDAGEVADGVIESWLESEDFESQAIRFHSSLVWNKLSLGLFRNRRLVRSSNIYYNPVRANNLRGARAYCGDFEASVDSMNSPTTWETDEDGVIEEGWVWVSPYWDPENPIQVCAFDAQFAEETTEGVDCSTREGQNALECGCGPSLQWCYDVYESEDAIKESIEEEVAERMRLVLNEKLSYEAFLMAPWVQMNGPMVHMYRHLVDFDDGFQSPMPVDELPDLAFDEMDTWVKMELEEQHSGVLTSPIWLLRHQTNRGRANRFYGGFLCEEFIPVEGKIEGLSELGTPSPDLSRRNGCQDCHARLEPWASYWGRWGQANLQYIAPSDYPWFTEECATCNLIGNCSDLCEDNYIVEAAHQDENPYLGWLSTYAFLDEEEQDNPLLGPSAWVEEVVDNGTLAECAAKNAAGWLLGWEGSDLEDESIQGWADAFSASGYEYQALIYALVTSEQYWRQQ
jgi:hypothetical protein